MAEACEAFREGRTAGKENRRDSTSFVFSLDSIPTLMHFLPFSHGCSLRINSRCPQNSYRTSRCALLRL